MPNCDACYGEKTEDCPDDCLTSHIRYEEREFYVDYRFIAKANNEHEAGKKVDALILGSTDDVWYTIVKIIEKSEFKENGEPQDIEETTNAD